MKKFKNVDSIQVLLEALTLNHEHNAWILDQLNKLVDQEVASAPVVTVAVEDIFPFVPALPAVAPVPLFSGHSFCVGDHVEILNPNKKLKQSAKGVVEGKTRGGDSGGFLRIRDSHGAQILRKPWKLRNLSC